MGPGSVLSGVEFGQGEFLSWVAANHVVLSTILVWLFGAIFGFLLAGLFGLVSRGAVIVRWSSPAALLRRCALMVHGLVILRDLWYTRFAPGTVRKFLRRMVQRIYAGITGSKVTKRAGSADLLAGGHVNDNSWPVTVDDLTFFKSRVELGDADFKMIVNKNIGDTTKYHAMYRVLPGNQTEYKSVTIARNATAEEMTDFYLDDDYRSKWDGLIARHEILENGPMEDRRQMVHWIRSFPFPFLSDREYVIARRTFVEGDTIYTLSKSCEHPDAPRKGDIVRMDAFYSMWSCRTIKCPWGTDDPACEIVLYHHEQFKIPERLARFAACKGMWGFVKGMVPYIKQFVQERRAICDPAEQHPHPYGYEAGGLEHPQKREPSEVETHRERRVARTLGRTVLAAAVTATLVVLKPR